MSSSFVKDCSDASGASGSNSASKTLIIIVNNEGGNVPLGGQEIQSLLANHVSDTSQVSVLQMGSGGQPSPTVNAPASYIPEAPLPAAPINFMVGGFEAIPIEDSSAAYDEIPLDDDTLQSLEKAFEAKEILTDPLLDLANSTHFGPVGSASGDDDHSNSGGQRKRQKSPTRRSQRQMDKVEREEVEKIRAENRQMLQQEREELMKAQEEREALENKTKEEEASKAKTGKGKGKGKYPHNQKVKGRGKGKGEKVMPTKDDSEDEQNNNASDDSDQEDTERSSSSKAKGKQSKPKPVPGEESSFPDVKVLKDIKMKPLTINVEKLNVKEISTNKQDESKSDSSPTPPTNAEGIAPSSLDGEDLLKKEATKKTLTPKSLKEFEPALFSTPDIMLKVKGDTINDQPKIESEPLKKKKSPHAFSEYLQSPDRAQTKEVPSKSNPNEEVTAANSKLDEPAPASDSKQYATSSHHTAPLPQDTHPKRGVGQVLDETNALQVQSQNHVASTQKEIPVHRKSPLETSKDNGQTPKNVANLPKKASEKAIAKEAERPPKETLSLQKEPNSSKHPNSSKDSSAIINHSQSKAKPSLNRNNVISKPDKNPDFSSRASILMQSPTISKSLMNYKIPLKNSSKNRASSGAANPSGTAPQSTNPSRSGEPPHNPNHPQSHKNTPSKAATKKPEQNVSAGYVISRVKEMTPNKKGGKPSIAKPPALLKQGKVAPNSPIIKNTKLTQFHKPREKASSTKSGRIAADAEEVGGSAVSPHTPNDIRRSKRPAKKKSFGDDILFLDEKTFLGDEKENDIDDEYDATSECGQSPDNSPSEEEEEEEDDDEGVEEYDDPDRLWCICQKPHHNRFMICCDRCEDWFHGSCVGVTKAMGKQWELEEREWICPNCRKAERAIKGIVSPIRRVSQVGTSLPVKGAADMEVQVLQNDDQPSVTNKYGSAPVLVYEKSTGVLLTGSDAPTLGVLPSWLKKHPNYAPISMSMMESIKTDPKTGVRRVVLPSSSSEEPPDSDYEEPKAFPAKSFYGSSPKKKEKKSPKHSSSILKREEGEVVIREKKKADPARPDGKSSPSKSTKKPHFNFSHSTNKEGAKVPRKTIFEGSPSSSPSAATKDRPELARKSSFDKKEESSRKHKEKKHKSLKSPEIESILQPKPKFPPIRSSVRKMLFEALDKRRSEVPHEFKNTKPENIQELCQQIEEQLYLSFNKDLGFKYKARYRSLVFNIRDSKNGGLFRQILTGTIPPAKLAVMTSEELASKELAEWREKEEKKELEAIQKHELEMLALGNQYIMKSHKGEIMIDKDDFIKSKETAPDIINNLPTEGEAEPPPSQEHEEDIINSHRNHIYHPNCKICIENELKSYRLSDKDDAGGDKENLDISKKRERTESESSRRHHSKKHKKEKRHRRSDSERRRSDSHSKSKHRDKDSSEEGDKHRSSGRKDDGDRRRLDEERRRSGDRKHSESDRSRKRHHRRRESSGSGRKESRSDSKDEKRRRRRHSSDSSRRHKRRNSERRDDRKDSSSKDDERHKRRRGDKTSLNSGDNKHSDSDAFEDAIRGGALLYKGEDNGGSGDSKPEVSTSEDIVFLPNPHSKAAKNSPDGEPTSTGSPFAGYSSSSPEEEEEEEHISPITYTPPPPSSPSRGSPPSTPPLRDLPPQLTESGGGVGELASFSPSHDKSPPTTPPLPADVEDDLLSPATPPLPDDEDRLTPPPPSQHGAHAHKSLLTPIWKGSINMPDVAKFSSAAFEVSGKSRCFGGDVPQAFEVVGRISPDAVWQYIAQMKKSGSKEILVTRFQPSSEIERASYIALYSYLSAKKRYGVVGPCGKSVKDFYIVPLAAHQPIPQVLLPLDGPGFEESRPHMLIGVIIRAKQKRTYDPVGGVWIEETSQPGGHKRASIDKDSSNTISSTLESLSEDDSDKRSYTPPPPTLKKPRQEPRDSKLARSTSTSDEETENYASDKPELGTAKISHSADRDSMLAELNRQIERDRKELSEMQRTMDEKIEEGESHTPPGSPPQSDTLGATLDTSKISIPSNLHEILNNIKKKEEAIKEKELEIKRRLNLNFQLSEGAEPTEETKDIDLRLLVPQSVDAPSGSWKDEDMRLLTAKPPMMGGSGGGGPPLPHSLGDTDFRMRDPRILKQDGSHPEEENPQASLSKMSDEDLLEKVKQMEGLPPPGLPPHYQERPIKMEDQRGPHPPGVPPPFGLPPKQHHPINQPPMEGGFGGPPMPPYEHFDPAHHGGPERGPPHGPPIGPNAPPPPFLPPRHGGRGPPIIGNHPDFNDPNFRPPPPLPHPPPHPHHPPPRPEKSGQPFHHQDMYHHNAPHPPPPDLGNNPPHFPQRPPPRDDWEPNRGPPPPGGHWNDRRRGGRYPEPPWDGREQPPFEECPPHPPWHEYPFDDRRNPNHWKRPKKGGRGGFVRRDREGEYHGPPGGPPGGGHLDNPYWQKGKRGRGRKWHRSSNEGGME